MGWNQIRGEFAAAQTASKVQLNLQIDGNHLVVRARQLPSKAGIVNTLQFTENLSQGP